MALHYVSPSLSSVIARDLLVVVVPGAFGINKRLNRIVLVHLFTIILYAYVNNYPYSSHSCWFPAILCLCLVTLVLVYDSG